MPRFAIDPPSATSPDLARLSTLHRTLRDEVKRRAAGAAPHLLVDLDHCAAWWAGALAAGARYRPSAASAQMLASASLGLLWLGDERFAPEGPVSAPSPQDAAALKAWAEAGWADRHAQALGRLKTLQATALPALDRAAAAHFDAASMRQLAGIVFQDGEEDRLARFMHEERRLLASAMHGVPAPDPRLADLCTAADLVHGLGRFVRLAVAMRPSAAVSAYPRLLEVIDELAG